MQKKIASIRITGIVGKDGHISESSLRAVLRLIVEHRIQYKLESRAIEQKLRAAEVHKLDRAKYCKQVLSDCKKWKKRVAESRTVALRLLGVDPKLYHEELAAKFGDERTLERNMYLLVVRDRAATGDGLKFKENAKEIMTEYNRQLYQVVTYLAAHSDFQRQIKEVLDKDTVHLRQMITLDSMYSSFGLDDLSIDLVRVHAGELKDK